MDFNYNTPAKGVGSLANNSVADFGNTGLAQPNTNSSSSTGSFTANGNNFGNTAGSPGVGGTTPTPADSWQNISPTGSWTPQIGNSSSTGDGSASTDPTIVANRLAKQRANQGPAIYGANGNQTLGEFQQWQSDEFNKNQLAAQGQFNAARAAMPYNTQGNLANPYDQYVANPATPGHASAAFNTPQNAAAWNNSGLANTVANPTSLANGNTFASGGNQDYRANQLNFLLQALQHYGPGGQNRFGNGFSPIFTGGPGNGQYGINNPYGASYGPLNGLGNSTNNPGGYQNNFSGMTSGGLGIAQVLPLLLGLAQNNNNPQAGAYGNLGGYGIGQSSTASPMTGAQLAELYANQGPAVYGETTSQRNGQI